MHTRTTLLIAGLALLTTQAHAQDQVHYVPPMVARNFGGNEVDEHRLVLSTNASGGGDVNVTRGDGTPLPGSPFLVDPNSPTVVDLGSGGGPYENLIDQGSVNAALDAAGLILTSNTPGFTFFAEVRHRDGNQGGSATMKGRLGLGQDFRCGFLASDASSPVHGEDSHFISVMATEDGTTVQFSDLDPAITLVGPPPTSVTLDAGQSYAIQAHLVAGVNADLLNGARVTSNKPVAVHCGSWLAGNRPSSGGRDIGVDQVTPVDYIRDEWIVFQGIEPNEVLEQERPTIVAAYDDTQVFVNGSAVAIATIDAGDYYAIPATHFQATSPNAIQAMHITTSQNAYLYQSLHNALNGPALGLVPPLPCSSGERVVIEAVDYWGPAYIKIVTRPGATVTLNGAMPPVGSGPDGVNGTTDWVVYNVTGLTGDVAVDSTEQFVCTLQTGVGNRGTAGTYTGFANAPLVISPFEVPGSDVVYPVTLSLEQINGYDPNGFQWYLDDAVIPGATTASYTANGPGRYSVTGTSPLCGSSPISFSVELPAQLDIELEAQAPTRVNDTQYDVPYRAVVTNRTGGTVSDLEVVDDLEAGLAPLLPGTHWVIQGAPTASGDLAAGDANPAFDGRTAGDPNLLAPGVDLVNQGVGVIDFVVRVTITGGEPAQATTATVRESSGAFSDSDTAAFPPLGSLSVSLRAGEPRLVGGTVYDVDYTVTAENGSDLPVTNLALVADIESAVAPLTSADWALQVTPMASGAFAAGDLNASFDGRSAGDTGLLDDGVDLLPGQSGVVTFTVRVDVASGRPTGSLSVRGAADNGVSDTSDDEVGDDHLSVDGPDADLDPTNDPTPFPTLPSSRAASPAPAPAGAPAAAPSAGGGAPAPTPSASSPSSAPSAAQGEPASSSAAAAGAPASGTRIQGSGSGGCSLSPSSSAPGWPLAVLWVGLLIWRRGSRRAEGAIGSECAGEHPPR